MTKPFQVGQLVRISNKYSKLYGRYAIILRCEEDDEGAHMWVIIVGTKIRVMPTICMSALAP